MSLLPNVTLANLTTPVTSIGEGGGGGGAYNPNPSFSTITINPTTLANGLALKVNMNLGARGSVIQFANPDNLSKPNLWNIATSQTGALPWDTAINSSPDVLGGSSSGKLSFGNWSTITMLGGGALPSTLLTVANIECATINGEVPGGGGAYNPNPSFSTITLATGGAINASQANLAISTINGVVPGGSSTSQSLPISAFPVGTGDFATNIDSASAVLVSANPLTAITTLPIGHYSISIPYLNVNAAQSAPGVPVPTTTVPYGTRLTYSIRVGTVPNTAESFLKTVDIIPTTSGVVTEANLLSPTYATFYNPSAIALDTFAIYCYAALPTGTTGSGNWSQQLFQSGTAPQDYVTITSLS